MSRWTLPPEDIPSAWFNVVPHLATPPQPPLHPGTREPVGPADLAPLFPMALIEQEVSAEPWIDVPGEVLDILRLWRPTPLVRATRLEQALGTPARIYFKDESGSPAGSHKPNTAVPQAFYNAREGITRLSTETGAGQWGTALAFACAQFDLDLKVYMVRASYGQKPYRRIAIETWGGEVVASPVDQPDHPGSLGVAISDAVRDCVARADTHYALGSVLNHVLLHQTVIGLEAREQLALAGERLPDVVIAPCGGGSNLGGIAFPFVPDAGVRLLAVEPTSCPTLTRGLFGYDAGDTAGLTPLMPMYSLGRDFVPPSIHAGGLRYHGDSPLVSQLVRDGRMEAIAYPQGRCSRLRSCSPGRRARSRRRSAATGSGRRSTRPWRRRRPARSG
jgi:tryptophan synthase beta chain